MTTGVPTAEAARLVGISQRTLQRWIRTGKVKAPEPTLRHGRGIRLWSLTDIAHLAKAKVRIYRKGRGRN